MTINQYQSWGRYPQAVQTGIPIRWRSDPFPAESSSDYFLPYGRGRSYGDCCLNDGGKLLDTASLERFIAFDPDSGILRAEAGMMLSDVLRMIVPKGWFLPVTPGTKFVSLGGAVANDVHGKNHHRAGTFGHYVRAFELLRSDNSRLICTPDQNPELFRATIAGLGLTGLILWVEFQLIRIDSPWMDVEYIKFRNLEEFLAISAESDKGFAYTVAWMDASPGRTGQRGIFMRGNHAALSSPAPATREPKFAVPSAAPSYLLNRRAMTLFNSAFYNKQWAKRTSKTVHYDSYFYPLDGIAHWNRVYGKAGFVQFQCVLPMEPGKAGGAITQLLNASAQADQVSFLTVLKVFGDRSPAGMLSFPRKGITLTLDFPVRGKKTLALLETMDDIVRENNGAIYPAKDACMSAKSFRQYFPGWKEFSAYMDPRFSSSFWRRVTA